jgi:hypothetical protein
MANKARLTHWLTALPLLYNLELAVVRSRASGNDVPRSLWCGRNPICL